MNLNANPSIITDNLDELLAVLPPGLATALAPEKRDELLEIVLDLGRRPEARYIGNRAEYLRDDVIQREELHFVEDRLGAFGDDNRAGIAATLHRISALRNRRGEIVGLTLRVGRAVSGIGDIVRDLIISGQSLLLMGRPGLGKTTLLREMARVLADEENKRVMVVDTSNEIAGDGDVPHPAIGRARRMQVAQVAQQHDVMIEAVENHMPEVVVIDEIGRVEEAVAARTIAERGVQLVATVHGNTLENLVANPSLSDLVGGIQAVTLSDEEARRRGTQKTVLERKAPPTFDVVVEMMERDKIAVRAPVADVVDALLRGMELPPEIRWRDENGAIQSERLSTQDGEKPVHDFEMRGLHAPREYSENGKRPRDQRGRDSRERSGRNSEERNTRRERRQETRVASSVSSRERHKERRTAERYGEDQVFLEDYRAPELRSLSEYSGESAPRLNFDVQRDDGENNQQANEFPDEPARVHPQAMVDVSKVRSVYPFGVSRSRLGRAIKQLGLPLSVTRSWHDSDAVIMLTGSDGTSMESSFLREPRELGLPIIGVEGNSYAQISSRLSALFGGDEISFSPRDLALKEAHDAAQRVLAQAAPVEMRPQNKTVRRAQHLLAEKFHLRSYSIGREPNRRVRFLPGIAPAR